MKYMIMTFGSQEDYDGMSGKTSSQPAWSKDDFVAMVSFMQSLSKELTDSGELLETRGLSAPVHARRIRLSGGAPVVTDGPYAETEEVLAGYWIVDCESFDRATEIAVKLSTCPGPEQVRTRAFADVRPIDEHVPDHED